MAFQNEIGKQGEDLAVNFLVQNGYAIKERNWHFGHDELDIIAIEGNELVIVEVKTRTGNRWEHPSEAVSKQKIRHIVEAADAYIRLKDIRLETRFDVITIIFEGTKYELEHFKEAFIPGM